MLKFTLCVLRKIHHILTPQKNENATEQYKQYTGYVEMWDQDANDYVYQLLESGLPCMISKFGTSELFFLTSHLGTLQTKYTFKDYKDFIQDSFSIDRLGGLLMKNKFWCVHYIIIDKDGYMETVYTCLSKEIAEKVARSYSRGKAFICYEEKEA